MSIIEYFTFLIWLEKVKKHFAKHILFAIAGGFVCSVSVYRVINNINSSFYVILSNKDSTFFDC